MNQTPTEIRRSITAACDGLDPSTIIARLADAFVTIDYATREIEKLRQQLSASKKRERL